MIAIKRDLIGRVPCLLIFFSGAGELSEADFRDNLTPHQVRKLSLNVVFVEEIEYDTTCLCTKLGTLSFFGEITM